jgi:hypothetical protein
MNQAVIARRGLRGSTGMRGLRGTGCERRWRPCRQGSSGMSWWPLRCQDEPVLLWAARLLTADIVLLNLRFSIHPLYIDWG